VKSKMRSKMGLIAGSLQLLLYRIVDLIPFGITRILLLKLMGAKLTLNTAINHGIQWRLPHRVTIGDDVFLAEDLILDARGGLIIGSHVSINSRVQIWTAQHDWQSPEFTYISSATTIGNHCWICSGSIILPGVKIGEGAVIAAGSVVTNDVLPWTLVGGSPARKLKDRPKVDQYSLEARRNKMLFW
jgi:putative colanic acid biosynthesis acetyltransferase WcaF